jgi:hypothetical protein
MDRGGRRRRGRVVATALLLVVIGLVTVLASGCGGEAAVSSSTTAASSTPSQTAQPSVDGEGVLVAKEILGTFDALVAEVAELAKDKPDAAVLTPRLEQLYESYVPKMTELNGKYLALRDSGDISQFGECNAYLGSYRGQHVIDKDNVLSEVLRYYNFELGDQEMVSLLSDKPVELLDIAVDQG